MKLIGDLKKQVEQANSKEEAKSIIEKLGIILTDKEIDEFTGGSITPKNVGQYRVYIDSFKVYYNNKLIDSFL